MFKTKRFWINAYYIEIGFGARWPLSHFKIHKYPQFDGFYRHIVWGKFSLIISQPQLETVTVCSDCDEEIGHASFGDECLSHCENCQQVEGKTHTVPLWEYENRS